jgi:NodT family efflux transporter outer membrane factor (OMF) lipoprotein
MEVVMRSRIHVRVAVVLVAAATAACVSAPAYQPPTVVIAPEFRAITDSGVAGTQVDSTGPLAGTSGADGNAAVGVRPTHAAARLSALDTAARLVAGSPAGASRDRASGTSATSPFVAAPPSSHVSAEAPEAPFWIELGDSTLVSLVREALHENPDVHVAESRLRAARGSRRLSAFDFAPTITASAGVSRQQLSTAQLPGLSGPPPRQDLWDGGFDASWELDIFGRISHTVRAEDALAQSAENDLHDVQLSLAAEVARTYFELRGAQSERAVAMRNAENQRRTVALTEERLHAGSGTAFDTERAKAELALTLAATPAIEARIAASQYRLAVLLGQSPETLPKTLLTAEELPPLPDVVRVGSPERLVRHRPDVLSAERALAAQTMLVGAAKSEYLPRLSIGASVGYTAGTFDALGEHGTPRYFVGPVLSWSFLDLGRVKTHVNIAHAQADEARAHYTSAVLGAIEEAETAIATYDRSRARLTGLREASRASAHALELAQLRFQAGATDFLQVLDAQRTLLDAESQLAVGRTAAATALVAVYKAVGGGWPGK